MYFAWDQEKNQMIYIMADLETVYYPEDYTLKAGNCWITVGDAAEAAKVGNMGYNLALEKDFTEDIELTSTVSIDTLGFKCSGNITMADGDHNVETCYLIGQFTGTSTSIAAKSTNVVNKGSVASLSVTSAKSVTINGSVGSYSAASGVSSTVSSTGQIKSVASGNSSSITNNGYIVANSSSAKIEGTEVGTKQASVSASSRDDLESIRTQVASGSRTFEGETITLTGDVDLKGIAMTPIANVSRDGVNANSTNVFKGTFDGDNYTLKDFSTSGFSVDGLNAGTNSSSVPFGEDQTVYNEAIYGLLGVTYNATIKDLKIDVDIDLVIDNGKHYVGDSVGGIVGCAFGTTTFENCTVSGTINGYDGVGGLLGRAKDGATVIFINCTNNANVTGVRKTGGFIGSSYEANVSVTYTNCVNNGNITCLGRTKDLELEAKKGVQATELYGYYSAGASNGEYLSFNGSKVTAGSTFTNNGKIKVGTTDVGDGTYINAGKQYYGNGVAVK